MTGIGLFVDAGSVFASPSWVDAQLAPDGASRGWWEDNHPVLLQEVELAWDDDPEASDRLEPVAEVAVALFARLARQRPGDVSSAELVDGLAGRQHTIGFATARMWVEIAELHVRFAGPARSRLDAALDRGDECGALEAADEIDLADRSLAAEIATSLSWSGGRAQGQLEIALILTTDLVATLDAVARGELEVRKAEAMARALLREGSDLRRRVEGEILPEAGGWTLPELGDKIREAVLRLAPELAAERAAAARRSRGVSFRSEPDDMIRLEALLPVEHGIKVQAALDQTAWDLKHGLAREDDRTIDQLRADVLADAVIGLVECTEDTPAAPDSTTPDPTVPGSTAPDPTAADSAAADHTAADPSPTSAAAPSEDVDGDSAGPRCEPAGRPERKTNERKTNKRKTNGRKTNERKTKRSLRQEIVMTVPFETVTGGADHPGHLSRYGPISAPVARAMALEVARDGYWRCAVTDDVHGTLLGLGRSTFTPAYRVPEYLQRFTNLRDRVCSFPGCRQAAAACDWDHTIPHPEGATCECGGGDRCGSHHRLKHETAWSVRRSEDPAHPPGTHVWTSPLGREHLSSPPCIGVPIGRVAEAGAATIAAEDAESGEDKSQPPPF